MRALNVAIYCIAEYSSLNSISFVARFLRERGHKVTFASFPTDKIRLKIEQMGFEFHAVGSKGTPHLPPELLSSKGFFRHIAISKAKARMNARLFSDVERFLAQVRPELAFLDYGDVGGLSYLSKNRVPTILFPGGSLAKKMSLRYPPIMFRVPVVGKSGSLTQLSVRIRNLWAWLILVYYKLVAPLLPLRKFLVYAIREQLPLWRDLLTARLNGWKLCFSDWGMRPDLPEFVFGQQSFDHPLASSPKRLYLQGYDAAPSRSSDPKWGKTADDDRPLIYCVISTVYAAEDLFVHGAPTPTLKNPKLPIKQFLDVVVTVFKSRPEWQLIMSCGILAQMLPPGSLPANVRVYEHVPQLEVLQNTSLLIAQAGPSTLREAIRFSVPMLVFPRWTDQFGNTEYVRYHNIGLPIDLKVTADELSQAIESVLGDARIKTAMARMSERARREADGEDERLINFVKEQCDLDV